MPRRSTGKSKQWGKGGKEPNLKRRSKQWDSLGTDAKKGFKRPGSNKK